jgi:very-short-patch-repair endonuclease
LRQAIEEIGRGAWSAPEARAATILRAANIPSFKQNARIDLPDGRYFVADFLWRELRAILEIDSMEHHFENAAQIEATHERHLQLESLGYSVAHRTPRLVANEPIRFRMGIERWLAARRRELSAR